MSILTKPYFFNEFAAIQKVESILWPQGPVCPHCGGTNKIYELRGVSTRPGLKKCGHCRKQFTVKVGTIFKSSHVPLYKWLQAIYLLCSSKKGISSNQLHRTLEVTLKTAWFMSRRIREGMKDDLIEKMTGIVEVDETFIGRDFSKKPRHDKKGRGYAHKHKVLTLVQRNGTARSMVIDDLKAKTIVPILQKLTTKKSRIMTDEAGQCQHLTNSFREHHVVHHGNGEYVRGDIHTNTIEGLFSVFKRGMKGIYQHCAKRHLHRYMAEFDFRYNTRKITDPERALAALSEVIGKRLIYRVSLIE